MDFIQCTKREDVLKYCNGGYLCQYDFWGSECTFTSTYYIYYGASLLGFVDITINTYKNGRKYANINMIELFDIAKHKGYGKIIISEVFRKFNLSSMFGEALPSAIPFWKGLGADFEMSDNKLMEYMYGGWSACFKLTRKGFKQ
jgi:predicted acetyltransferase